MPEAVDLVVGIFTELASALPSALFSTGGDEINMPCYTDDYEFQQILNETGLDFNGALASFTAQTHKPLIEGGKTVAVWEGELVLAKPARLAVDDVQK